MLSNGRSRLDACSEGGVSGFLPRKTMVSDGCASKFPWCKFLFSTNVLWYSKTIDLAALSWLSSRGIDKSENHTKLCSMQSIRCDTFLPARTHFAPDYFCPHTLCMHMCFLPRCTPHPHLKIFYLAHFYIFLLVTVKGIMWFQRGGDLWFNWS